MNNIDDLMRQFRLASREIFNHFFRIPDPYNNDGWVPEERFSEVQALLFQKLVTEPAGLPGVTHGGCQPSIGAIPISDRVPAQLNRERVSVYWDHPVEELTQAARLCFKCFFDWDQLGYRDNQYARVRIETWPSHPDLVGKDALVEAR